MNIIQQNYSLGAKIHWSGYSSTTNKLAKAKEFAGKTGVIMKISILNGKSIVNYSAFPIEDEILLSPNLKLFVSEELYQGDDGYNYIDLIQEKIGPTFVF